MKLKFVITSYSIHYTKLYEASVYDMVYAREGTPLQKEAQSRGHRAANGLGMLVAQGEAAFALWTGQVPPSGVMAASILTESART